MKEEKGKRADSIHLGTIAGKGRCGSRGRWGKGDGGMIFRDVEAGRDAEGSL